MPATDGHRGWVCFPSPKPRNKRLADSMSWPETAQATVSLAGAGLLLKTQAEPGQTPSLTGLQQTVIPTCVGLLGRKLLATRRASRREGWAAAFKKTGSRVKAGGAGAGDAAGDGSGCQDLWPARQRLVPSEENSLLVSETRTPWRSLSLEYKECSFSSGKNNGYGLPKGRLHTPGPQLQTARKPAAGDMVSACPHHLLCFLYSDALTSRALLTLEGPQLPAVASS